MALMKDGTGQQIGATLSDGSLRGTTGPMAKVSWSDLPVIAYNSGSGFSGSSPAEMQDGGPGSYGLSCGVAGSGHGASLGTVARFAGPCAVRVRAATTATQPPVDLIVNGRCVEGVRSSLAQFNGIASASYTDRELTAEFPYALKHGRHTIVARVDPNPDGTTVNVIAVSGWSLPRAFGFRDSAPAPRKSWLSGAMALTTTATLFGNFAEEGTIALHLVNTDTANARLVTLYREDGVTIYDTVSLLAATSASQPTVKNLVFPAPRNLTSWKIKADGTGVTVSRENV